MKNIDKNEYKITYKKRARDELEKIYRYIKERLKETRIAKKTVDNIREKILNLTYFPFAYKSIKKLKILNIKNL